MIQIWKVYILLFAIYFYKASHKSFRIKKLAKKTQKWKNKCSSLFIYVFISGFWFASQVLYFLTEEQSLWLQVWSSAHVQYLLFVFNFIVLYIYLCSTDTSDQRCVPVFDMYRWPTLTIWLHQIMSFLKILSVPTCQCLSVLHRYLNYFPNTFSHCSFDITLLPFVVLN
jgi:hypothetical protein